jgi:hypothetical protein
VRDGAGLAERAGFEPAIPLRVCRISSAVLSTTQPPLQGAPWRAACSLLSRSPQASGRASSLAGGDRLPTCARQHGAR